MKPEKEQAPPPPPPPPLISVQELGTLVSLTVNYASIIEFNQQVTQDIPWTQWEFRFGVTRVLLLARGECLIGIDLKLAKYEQSSTATKTATLVVPTPKTISARLNLDPNSGGSSFYAVDTHGVAALVPGSDGQRRAMNLALQKGQSDIQKSCTNLELLEAARKSAETVLLPIVSTAGWKIAIAWR